MATLSNTDLRNGVVFQDGGEAYSVLKYVPSVRGRGSSIVKVKVRNLRSGSIQELTYRQNEKVESVETLKTSVQYLYSDSDVACFMNTETYEQFEMPLKLVGDSVKYLKEGEKVIVMYLDGDPVSIEIPRIVELEIKYTEPAVKGNTATNAMKNAKMENDLEVKVPLFSKVGDSIRVNTDTGEYVSRV